MIRTLPSPLVWAMSTRARSFCATLTSRNWSPILDAVSREHERVAFKEQHLALAGHGAAISNAQVLIHEAAICRLAHASGDGQEKTMIGRFAVKCFMIVAP